MTTVLVWLEEWEFACCGTPFAIGDAVSWSLHAGEGPRIDPALVPPRDHDFPLLALGPVVGRGDLRVTLVGDAAVDRRFGLLTTCFHGPRGPGPSTTGRVGGIRVVGPGWVEPTDTAVPPGRPWNGFLVDLDVRT